MAKLCFNTLLMDHGKAVITPTFPSTRDMRKFQHTTPRFQVDSALWPVVQTCAQPYHVVCDSRRGQLFLKSQPIFMEKLVQATEGHD